jgi:hypothetical protein
MDNIQKSIQDSQNVPSLAPKKISTDQPRLFSSPFSQQRNPPVQPRELRGYTGFSLAQNRDEISAGKSFDRWNKLDTLDGFNDAIGTERKEAADQTRKPEGYEEEIPFQNQAQVISSIEQVNKTSASPIRSTSRQAFSPGLSNTPEVIHRSTPDIETRDPRRKRKNTEALHSAKRYQAFDGSGNERVPRRRSARITHSKDRLL